MPTHHRIAACSRGERDEAPNRIACHTDRVIAMLAASRRSAPRIRYHADSTTGAMPA